MITDEIMERLFALRDEEFGRFQARLMPTADPESIIGVRTPQLRSLAKEMIKRADAREFLDALPHRYFDENQLHAFMISEMKDFGECASRVQSFLPFVDNWATCDQLSPKIFRNNKKDLLARIREWLKSERTYTVRFGLGMLMQHFLDTDFSPEYLEMAASVRSEEYYVRMMQAWYFATALAKQYKAALPYVEGRRLDPWTHSKTIQKAIESYRITPEQKTYLRSLK